MAWFKVDDGFHHSAKVLSIPRGIRAESLGLWIIAGTWSADNMTDGFVPDGVIADWPVSADAKTALVDAGLWISVDGGVRFHDWCEYQPTREQMEAKANARHERSVKAANARWNKDDASAMLTDANAMPDDAPVPVPVPVPLPLQSSSVVKPNRTRKSSLNAEWKPSEAGYEFAKQRAPGMNIAVQIEKFVNYNFHSNRLSADWDAAWRTWVIKAVEFDPSLAVDAPAKKQFRAGENV